MFALALALVLGQFGAIAHALGHSTALAEGEERSSEGALPVDACDACIAYSVFGNSVHTAAPALVLAQASFGVVASRLSVASSPAPTFFYLSRAPPVRLA